MRAAMSRTRAARPTWISASPTSSAKALCSAILRPVDARWKPLEPQNRGRVQVPTLRNVDKRPSPDFVKAYGHNGYFRSLKEIVHFYNTRDVLPRCAPHDPRERTGCWPAPETTENMNTSKVGNLGLSEQEEDALVAFMQTLSDGYVQTGPK